MKKSMLKWFALGAWAVVFCGSNGFAYEVKDPHHYLDQLDQYLSARSFQQAFQIDDLAGYTRLAKACQISCGPDGCGSMCQDAHDPMTRKITQAGIDQATIELEDGSTEAWTRDAFERLHGNSVRYAVAHLDAQLGVPGYLEAVEFKNRPYTLPSGTKIDGKEIVFDFHITGSHTTFKVRYTVNNQIPFAGQIVQMAAFGEWYYKLNQVTRAKR